MDKARSQFAKVEPHSALEIGQLRQAVSARSRLIHPYKGVDIEMVWALFVGALDVLDEQIRQTTAGLAE